ncbi:NOX5 (predicted) [Pycnogonum litorale]
MSSNLQVDFFWINRSHKSFGWFVNLLRQLELQESELYPLPDNRRFLDLHMYITSALDKANVKAILLQMALELMHKKAERDLITGLQTQTNPGRPNWDKVFTKLRDERVGKVTVFYCGPPQLGTIIRRKCIDFGFGFKKEKF